jgi:peptide-methionine (S)-S-oxide reductase
MGPPSAKPNPTYREVCTGRTGHVEVYDCTFEGDELTYEKLVRHFFAFHDPTTLNRQGNDRGTQYASVIFCYDDVQKQIATKVKNELQELVSKGKVSNYQVCDIYMQAYCAV